MRIFACMVGYGCKGSGLFLDPESGWYCVGTVF